MSYKLPKYEDHSVKGYLLRQPIGVVKGELGRLLILEQRQPLSDHNQIYKAVLTEVLQIKGESTDIDLSSLTYTPPPYSQSSI